MSVFHVLSCDGHRLLQPCRGAFKSRDKEPTGYFLDRSVKEGWRKLAYGADLCPSRGHDEEPPP